MKEKKFSHIANLIKLSRTNSAKRMSQNDLSKKLGYNNGQLISNIERGLCGLPRKSMVHLCDVLDIQPQDMINAILKDECQDLVNIFEESKQKKNEKATIVV